MRRPDRPYASLVPILAVPFVLAACGGGADGVAESADPGAEASTSGSSDALATATFDVDGMTCGGCAVATEMSVKKLDGVASADAEYDEATGEGRCTVEYDPSAVDTDAIAAAIEEAGFTPSLTSTDGGG